MDDGNSVRLTLGDLFLLVFPKVTLYEHLPWILFAQNFLIIADIQNHTSEISTLVAGHILYYFLISQ